MRLFTCSLIIMAVCVLLAGCGGGGQTASSGTSSAALTIAWPARDKLVPRATESVTVQVSTAHGFATSQTVDRPADANTSTVNFPTLPTGMLTFTATAHPEAGGQGTPLAAATVTQQAWAGVPVQVRLSMATTITGITLTPAHGTIAPGESLQMTATATDADGNTVLVAPTGAYTWTSSKPDVADVDDNGKVIGLTTGTTTITATEKDSRESASTTMTVEVDTTEKLLVHVGGYNAGVFRGDLYLMNTDGSELTNITNTDDSIEIFGTISPDGTSIGFIRVPQDFTSSEICIMRADGSDVVTIKTFDGQASNLEWSPQGDTLLYEVDGAIYTCDISGSGVTKVADGISACWSPDGSEIAYITSLSDGELRRMTVEGADLGVLATNIDSPWYEPSWSVDNTLVYESNYLLFTTGLDGADPVTNGTNGYSPLFSPDGSRLAYSVFGEGSRLMIRDQAGVHTLYTGIDNLQTVFACDWKRINPDTSWDGDITIE